MDIHPGDFSPGKIHPVSRWILIFDIDVDYLMFTMGSLHSGLSFTAGTGSFNNIGMDGERGGVTP